jgi:hypothetical protein
MRTRRSIGRHVQRTQVPRTRFKQSSILSSKTRIFGECRGGSRGQSRHRAGHRARHRARGEACLSLATSNLYIAGMSIRPWRDIVRRPSRQIMVGNVPVGGDAPVTVQTMTNTVTSDVRATIDQIRRCEEAGADIIRVSCPDVESTPR